MSAAPTLDELLAAHAAGRLPAPLSLAVATHLALSPASRERYRQLEAVGGVLLDQLEPAPLAPDAWDRLRARLDEAAGEERRGEPVLPPAGPLHRIPRPLRDLLPPALEHLPWRRLGHAAAADLPVDPGPGYRTTLIRVDAGHAFPRHTHGGLEVILVLEGGFRDESGRYRRGDLQIADASVEHQPVAEEGEDWLWLRVLDAPLRRTGPLGRIVDRFRQL